MSDPELHMVQLSLDGKGLIALGKMLHLPLDRTDTGYLVHCALGELFGEEAPQPFSIEGGPGDKPQGGRRVRVLGYTAVGEETLQSRAQLDASPKVYSICDWERLAAKPMPQVFPEGMALQYELRSCPVVRKASSGRGKNQNGDTRSWEEGDELDAFLAEAWNRPDEDLSREQVYRDWLRRQFEIRGGAEPQSIGMERFSIERMTRRVSKGGDGKRKAHTIKRPDVTLTGALEVTGSEAFSRLLRSGLGRHKSFGYGMLKVRRA